MIVTDEDLRGLARGIEEGLGRGEAWEVVKDGDHLFFRIERLNVFPVVNLKPDVVLVMSLLGLSARVRPGNFAPRINPEKLNELGGFLKRMRQRCPKAFIIVQTQENPLHTAKKSNFEGKFDAWVSPEIDNLVLGDVLEGLATGKAIHLGQGVGPWQFTRPASN